MDFPNEVRRDQVLPALVAQDRPGVAVQLLSQLLQAHPEFLFPNHAHSCQAEEAEHPRTEEAGRADFSRRRRLKSYFDKLGTPDTRNLKGILDLLVHDERAPPPGPEYLGVLDLGFINLQSPD